MKTSSYIYLGIGLLLPTISSAATYTPLQPIEQLGIRDGNVDLTQYLESLFRGGIIIAGILAVIMVIVGGIQYMTTDAVFQKDEGKKRITAAIGGLILALSSVVLLGTINSELTRSELRVDEVKVEIAYNFQNPDININAEVAQNDPTVNPRNNYGDELQVRNLLAQHNIGVNKAPCPPGTRYDNVDEGCTSVGYLRQNTIDGVVALKNELGLSSLTLTGGSELGHSISSSHTGHGDGYKVDIGFNANPTFQQIFVREVLGGKDIGINQPTTVNYAGYRMQVIREIDGGEHYDFKFLDN